MWKLWNMQFSQVYTPHGSMWRLKVTYGWNMMFHKICITQYNACKLEVIWRLKYGSFLFLCWEAIHGDHTKATVWTKMIPQVYFLDGNKWRLRCRWSIMFLQGYSAKTSIRRPVIKWGEKFCSSCCRSLVGSFRSLSIEDGYGPVDHDVLQAYSLDGSQSC